MRVFVDLFLRSQTAGQPPRVTFHLLQTKPAELEDINLISSLWNERLASPDFTSNLSQTPCSCASLLDRSWLLLTNNDSCMILPSGPRIRLPTDLPSCKPKKKKKKKKKQQLVTQGHPLVFYWIAFPKTICLMSVSNIWLAPYIPLSSRGRMPRTTPLLARLVSDGSCPLCRWCKKAKELCLPTPFLPAI